MSGPLLSKGTPDTLESFPLGVGNGEVRKRCRTYVDILKLRKHQLLTITKNPCCGLSDAAGLEPDQMNLELIMRFGRHYMTRAQSRAWAMDNPIGPHDGGPAYGEKLDVGSVLSLGSSLIGGIMGSDSQSDAASTAAAAQVQAAKLGIDEQKRQFDAIQKLLEPYVNAGTASIGAQKSLIGLNGDTTQQSAISGISEGPEMAALIKQGENGILQNASATGGLRGGNIQGALAQFRPQMLAQLIQQRFQNLGGLTTIGQNAAAGTGNAGMQSANSISNLLQQQGAAQAGAALAQGKADANLWSGVTGAIGQVAGAGGFGSLGGFLGSLF